MSKKLPEPGDVVADKYVIERLLGRGGMGVVYVVTHRTTGKHLALKCLLPEYVEQPELVERFLREAQAAGRIEHRHIVDVFDAGRDGSILYIVMALLEGKSLTALLQDETLTLEETLVILMRAMDGVAAAHALGIVHRDLKPDNIFVCVGPSGRLDDPRVLDFGISKLEDDAHLSLTKSGVMMGTPYYMSFEQMNSQRDLDQRVDVYAMGVILYEALAGQLPYVAESTASLAIRMMTQPAMELSELRPDLPPGLSQVVMKAMARDRDERYPTMLALIEAIRPFAPVGAGSLVLDGQGTPLRSSRLSQLQAQGLQPTLTPMPKAHELLRTQQPDRSPLQVVTDQELSLRRVSEGSRGIGLMAILSAGVIALAIGIWALSRESTPSPAAQQPASTHTEQPAASAVEKARPAAAEAPTQTSRSPLPPVAQPTPAPTPVATEKPGKRGGKKPPSWKATKPQPGSEPAPPVVLLKGHDAGSPPQGATDPALPEPNAANGGKLEPPEPVEPTPTPVEPPNGAAEQPNAASDAGKAATPSEAPAP